MLVLHSHKGKEIISFPSSGTDIFTKCPYIRKYTGGMRLPVTKWPRTLETLKTYWEDKKYTRGKIAIIFGDDDDDDDNKFHINDTHKVRFSGIF